MKVIILAPSAKPLRRAANTLRGRIKVVINKKDNVVTIVSVEDGNVNKGTASVRIENKLDSQKAP